VSMSTWILKAAPSQVGWMPSLLIRPGLPQKVCQLSMKLTSFADDGGDGDDKDEGGDEDGVLCPVVKLWLKLSESLGKICCARPHIERFTFVDENANLGTAMRYEEIELRILLLCGSDLLESFCIPGLWKDSDMEVIVGDFGIVVVPRDGADTERIMNHSSILRKYKDNIIVVRDAISHPMSVVSSTKSRLALQHGDGHVVDYLSQPVIDYILQSRLYIHASG
uniref:Cytidyltransferase-like domain-containing protein n=1 Tax=Mola mola TaxID=94237 RepID=A0A3Q3VSD0_MOLML